MASLKALIAEAREHKDKKFAALTVEARSIEEHNDCTVKALAVACDVDYMTAHTALRIAGRKPRRGASWQVIEKALKSLNCSFERILAHPKYKNHNPAFASCKTVTSAEKHLIKNHSGERFILDQCSHVAGFDGKAVIDWTAGRKHRIRALYKITLPTSSPEPFSAPVREPMKTTLIRVQNSLF